MSNQYQRRDAGAVEAATDAALPPICPDCDGEGGNCPTCHGTGLMPTQADIDREAWEEQQADAARLEQKLAGEKWA